MTFVLELEDYYIPVDLEASVKEDDNVKHFYYGCEFCKRNDTLVRKSFCSTCNKDVNAIKIFPDVEKEAVGSRDMWDFKRILVGDVDIQRAYNTLYVKTGELKKPKASEIERWKKQVARIGKSKTLKDLFVDLVAHNQAIYCKVVMNGKKNDGWIMPNMKEVCLMIVIADGNKIMLRATESYKELLTQQQVTVAMPQQATQPITYTVSQ